MGHAMCGHCGTIIRNLVAEWKGSVRVCARVHACVWQSRCVGWVKENNQPPVHYVVRRGVVRRLRLCVRATTASLSPSPRELPEVANGMRLAR